MSIAAVGVSWRRSVRSWISPYAVMLVGLLLAAGETAEQSRIDTSC